MQKAYGSRSTCWISAVVIFLAITACGEVQDERLSVPPISDSDFAKISDRLRGEEQRLFNSWQVRMRTGGSFVGEVAPSNVRLAIGNQSIFEREQAQKAAAAEEERQAKLREDAFEKLTEIKEGLLDTEIDSRFHVDTKEYDTKPSFNKNGDYVGVEFSVILILRNKTSKPVKLVEGFIHFYDTRDTYLGKYSFYADAPVGGNGSLTMPVAMVLNSKNSAHSALQKGERLSIKWRLSDLQYESGERINMTWMERNGRFQDVRP